MEAALGHLRILDLCDLRGALAGRMLADLGADVLKVEPPGGERGRLRAPFAGERRSPDRSLPFLFRNANKGSVAIDLTDPSGRARLDELLDRADLLLENFTAADRTRLRLDPAAVRARHPHLVHVAVADFGLTGPRAAWTAEPICALAASGALYTAGLAELPPCNAPGHLAHDCASIYALAGALAALAERARSGLGQTVEISVQEAALAGLNPWSIPLADYARRYPVLPMLLPRNGDGPYTVLRARDGYLRVLPATPKQWHGILRVARQARGAGRSTLGAGDVPAREPRRHSPRRRGRASGTRTRGNDRAGARSGLPDRALQHSRRVRRGSADSVARLLPRHGIRASRVGAVRGPAVRFLPHARFSA